MGTIENYCIECKQVARDDCEERGHVVGTLGQSEPQLTADEAQLVIGAIPLQELPNRPARTGHDECAFIHMLPSGSVRCGALREHHSQYTGHKFTDPQPAAPESGDGWRVVALPVHGWGITYQGRELVSGIYHEETATQIIHDHALVPELVAALDLAAQRLDFLTNWIENSYGGENKDVELGRQYAAAARDAAANAAGKGGRG